MKKITLLIVFLLAFMPKMESQILFYENFDNPTNWDAWTVGHPAGTDTSLGWTNETTGTNPTCSPALGSGMAKFASFDFSRDKYDLSSPSIPFAGGSYRVTIKMYRVVELPTNADNIEVIYNIAPTSDSGTPLGTVNRSIALAPAETVSGWYTYAFIIPGNPTGDGYISILGTSGGGNNIFIDELIVENVPSCNNPSGLIISGITAFGATVDWTSPASAPASGYEYFYSTTNVNPTGPAMGTTVAGDTNASISGLLPSTVYYFWVRSVCSSSDISGWSNPRSFTTSCVPITSFPWTEGFENLAVGNNIFPICWDYTNTSSNWFIDETNVIAHTGTKSLRRSWSTNGWAFSPLATLTAGTSYSFSYYMRTKDAIVGYDITLGVGTGQTQADMVTTLSTVTGYQGINWTKFTYEFTPITTGNYSFGVKVVAPTAPNGINFDDFKLEPTPSCVEPSLLVASSMTSTSVNISWNSPTNSPANGYEYFYSTTNVAPTGAALGSTLAGITSTTLSGLLPATTYYIWVRSICSLSDISSWSSSLTFVTECVAVTSFFNNFDSALVFPTCWARLGTGGNTDIRTSGTTPNLTNVLYLYGDLNTGQGLVKTTQVSNLGSGTNRLKFDMRGNFSVGGIVEIGYLRDPSDPSTFVVLSSVTASSLNFTQFIFVPQIGVYSEYLALRHSGTPELSVLIDNVAWETIPTTIPSCASGISATINTTCGNFETQINWTAATFADGYKLSIGTLPGGTNILNNQIIGNVLAYSFVGNANTTYFYTVLPYNFVGNAVGCSEQSVTTFATGCFCDSLPTSNDAAGIANVQLGATNFPNGDVTYFDNTATPVNLPRGINTNLQITFATGYTYNTNVWIDFNDNLTFESSELFYSGESLSDDPTVLNASFIMPALATLGSHRMRIGTADSGQLTPDPCYSGTWGVTLDYTVNIIEAACTPATGVATLLSDCANNQFFVNVNVTALGSGTPSISNGTTSWPITSIGNVQVGPFPNGASSNALVLLHGSDIICNLPLGTFTYSCPPSNDECSEATVLTPGGNFETSTQNGTIMAATNSNEIPTCQALIAADVWYSVLVPASGNLTIETQAAATNSMTDSVVAVFSGTCGTLTQIGCNDDVLAGTNNFSKVLLTGQTPGATLYVGVWKYAIAAPTATNSGFQIAAYDASLLSTNTFNSAAFTYYPNPVKNTLNLSYSENISDVSVYNLLGQQVIAKVINANQSQIDMSNLARGTYLVKVIANNQVKTIKVIKE